MTRRRIAVDQQIACVDLAVVVEIVCGNEVPDSFAIPSVAIDPAFEQIEPDLYCVTDFVGRPIEHLLRHEPSVAIISGLSDLQLSV